MAKNKDGNETGVVIEVDNLLTQIAKQRTAKKLADSKPKKKAAKSKEA